MQTITRALANRGSAGEPLPAVFAALSASGFEFRRGQMTLIAGPPGGGKSAMALALAVALSKGLDLGTLYISADSDEYTQGVRAASMVTADSQDAVKAAFESGNEAYYEERLEEIASIQFEFEPDPTVDDVDELLHAYALLYGDWPALVVVDNLSDLYAGEDGGVGEGTLDKALRYLKTLTRTTRACTVVLHHLIGAKENGLEVAGMGDLRGKVGKIPESVLTLYKAGRPEDKLLGVAIVKNRGGQADSAGRRQVFLHFIPERMYVG